MATNVVEIPSFPSSTLFGRGRDIRVGNPGSIVCVGSDTVDATSIGLQYAPHESVANAKQPTRLSYGNMASRKKISSFPTHDLVVTSRPSSSPSHPPPPPLPPPPPPHRLSSNASLGSFLASPKRFLGPDNVDTIGRRQPTHTPPPPPPPGVPSMTRRRRPVGRRVSLSPSATRPTLSNQMRSRRGSHNSGLSTRSGPLSEPWGRSREKRLEAIPPLQRPIFSPARPRSLSSDLSSESEDVFGPSNLQFPPLLPTVESRATLLRDRKRLTNAIANTIEQTEKRANVTRQSHVTISESSRSRSVTSVTSDSESSDVDEKIQERWAQIKLLRKDVVVMKDDMSKVREDMRQRRQEKDKADTDFMNLVRLLITPDSSHHNLTRLPLEQRYAKMQSLQKGYQTLESTYETLEAELDRKEAELNTAEMEFFSLLAVGYLRAHTSAPSQPVRDLEDYRPRYEPDLPVELLGISSNGPVVDDHPLWRALVSAIGDMGLAQEDLDELRMRRDQVQYETDSERKLSMRARLENEEFMANYSSELFDKVTRLDEAKALVRNLHEECKDYGVAKKHPPLAVAYALQPDEDLEEDMVLDDMVSSPQTLAHDRFSTLLSCPDHVLREPEPLTALGELRRVSQLPPEAPGRQRELEAAMKEYGIHQLVFDTKAEAGDTDYVNRWLLHQLRTSPFEAYRLASMFQESTKLQIKDLKRWQYDVLRSWWTADAPDPRTQRRRTATEGARLSKGGYQQDSVPSLSLSFASVPRHGSRTSSEMLPSLPAWETKSLTAYSQPSKLSDSHFSKDADRRGRRLWR